MSDGREALARRVRALLPPGTAVREVPMFGGLSFMVDGAMAVAAGRDGDLLVRTDPARYDELLERDGAEPAVMGERPMGSGWLRVAPHGVARDEQMGFWIGVGRAARAGG